MASRRWSQGRRHPLGAWEQRWQAAPCQLRSQIAHQARPCHQPPCLWLRGSAQLDHPSSPTWAALHLRRWDLRHLDGAPVTRYPCPCHLHRRRPRSVRPRRHLPCPWQPPRAGHWARGVPARRHGTGHGVSGSRSRRNTATPPPAPALPCRLCAEHRPHLRRQRRRRRRRGRRVAAGGAPGRRRRTRPRLGRRRRGRHCRACHRPCRRRSRGARSGAPRGVPARTRCAAPLSRPPSRAERGGATRARREASWRARAGRRRWPERDADDEEKNVSRVGPPAQQGDGGRVPRVPRHRAGGAEPPPTAV